MKKRSDNLLFKRFQKINLFVLVLVAVLFDQLTKIAAAFIFPIACNRGVAFGIQGGGIFFSIAILALLLMMIRDEKSKYHLRALSLIFAGGFSNFVDRVIFGCVRDFIKVFDFFPVFNFADVVITVGVVVFAYFVIFKKDAKT